MPYIGTVTAFQRVFKSASNSERPRVRNETDREQLLGVYRGSNDAVGSVCLDMAGYLWGGSAFYRWRLGQL
jgi:hypothetical protein